MPLEFETSDNYARMEALVEAVERCLKRSKDLDGPDSEQFQELQNIHDDLLFLNYVLFEEALK